MLRAHQKTVRQSNKKVAQKKAVKKIAPKKKVIKQTKRRFQSNKNYEESESLSLDIIPPNVDYSAFQYDKIQIKTPLTTELSNGIKIITTNATVPISNVSVSIEAGSRYEPAGKSGWTHIVERLILRGTKKKTGDEIADELNQLGADITVTANRDHFVINGTTPTQMKSVLETIADILKNPAYDEDEVDDIMQEYQEECDTRYEDVDTLIHEKLHAVAFPTSGIGKTLYAEHEGLEEVTAKGLKSYHKKYLMRPNTMTISAVGIDDHEEFVELCKELFGDIKEQDAKIANDPVYTAKTEYVGGVLKLEHPDEDSEYLNIAMAFKAPGFDNLPKLIAANLIQSVLGGGASFSSGGPGKGMYTRFYRNVLCRYSWVNNIESFITTYQDASLLGASGQIEVGHGDDYIAMLSQELGNLPYTLNQTELDRAKNMLKTSVYNNLQDGGDKGEELARQVQLFGKHSTDEFVKMIDDIDIAEVQIAAAEILLTKPTLVIAGQTNGPENMEDFHIYDKETRDTIQHQLNMIKQGPKINPDAATAAAAGAAVAAAVPLATGNEEVVTDSEYYTGSEVDEEISGSGDEEVSGSGSEEVSGSDEVEGSEEPSESEYHEPSEAKEQPKQQ